MHKLNISFIFALFNVRQAIRIIVVEQKCIFHSYRSLARKRTGEIINN